MRIKGALALFVLVSGYTCARLSCILSFPVHVKLSYRIVSYRIVELWLQVFFYLFTTVIYFVRGIAAS